MSNKFDRQQWEDNKKRAIHNELIGRCRLKTGVLDGSINLNSLETLLSATAPDNPEFKYRSHMIPVNDEKGQPKMTHSFTLSITLPKAELSVLNELGKCAGSLKNLLFFKGDPKLNVIQEKDGRLTLEITPTRALKHNRYAQASMQMEKYAKKMLFLDVVKKIATAAIHPMTYSVTGNSGFQHVHPELSHDSMKTVDSFVALTQKTYVPNRHMGPYSMDGGREEYVYSKGKIDDLLDKHLTGLEKVEVANCFEDGINRAGMLYQEAQHYYPENTPTKHFTEKKKQKTSPAVSHERSKAPEVEQKSTLKRTG